MMKMDLFVVGYMNKEKALFKLIQLKCSELNYCIPDNLKPYENKENLES